MLVSLFKETYGEKLSQEDMNQLLAGDNPTSAGDDPTSHLTRDSTSLGDYRGN